MATVEQLEQDINYLKRVINGLSTEIKNLKEDVNSRVRLSDLSTTETLLNESIEANSDLIRMLDQKLAKIILPSDTRYYLEQGEVSSYQSNFSKLRAMMAKFEQLYNNLVAFEAKIHA